MDRDRIVFDRRRMTFRESDDPVPGEVFDEAIPDAGLRRPSETRLLLWAFVLLLGATFVVAMIPR